MSRWIRARITATDANRTKHIFTDVGPEELRKLKKKFQKVEIETPNDWGRYAEPRNDADIEEREEIEDILGITYEKAKEAFGEDSA